MQVYIQFRNLVLITDMFEYNKYNVIKTASPTAGYQQICVCVQQV